MDRMLFVNIGWMIRYQGLKHDQITGGGKYVTEHGYGDEIFNFQPVGKQMYGFGQAPQSAIRIENLGANRSDAYVDGVLVVWVAKSVIVGWYKNARVFRKVQSAPAGSNRTFRGKSIGYNITARASSCQILDPDARWVPIPRASKKRGGMGRYIWYAEDKSYEHFRKQVIGYVASRGKGGFTSPSKKHKTGGGGGGGHQLDPLKRLRIERAAITATKTYYEDNGYDVDSYEKDHLGWDLTAEHRNTHATLQLEVKGLSGDVVAVELTRNEYDQMRKRKKSYRVCVVTNALKKPKTPAIFAYSDETKFWEDQNERRLQIKEVTAARLSC